MDYCKDGKDNDGDHLVDKDDPGCPQKSSLIRDTGEEPGRQNDDCTISDLSCISIHLRDCYTHPKMASCDKKRYSPMGPIQPHPAEWQCTKEYNVEIKHEIPGVCSPVAERFGCMLECTSAKCAEFINEGCGAFANLEDAEKAAKDMQQKLKEKGGFDTVIIGASQTTSNAECMQMAKFIIKEGSITKEFDPCKFGQRCLQPDEIYKCMEDGKEVYGSCCLGPDLLTPVHMPGTRCPRYCNFGAACDAPDGYSFCALPPQTKEEKKVACCPVFSPVDPFQNVEADVTNKTVCPVPKKNGLVHRVDSSFSCDSAKASAKQDALDEFNKMKDTCASMPGGAFTGTCFLPTVITSSPLTCTASSMCTWSCSWTQY